MQVVWFKRDLRVADHAPLRAAAAAGPVVCLFAFEPQAWAQPEADARHFVFTGECLASLRSNLARLGARLHVVRADLPGGFERVERLAGPIDAVHAFEETGCGWSYARDKRVRGWLRERGIALHEYPRDGVVRRLATRDRWSRHWNRRMAREPLAAPDAIAEGGVPALDEGWPDRGETGLRPGLHADLQTGGEAEAQRLLESFLAGRGVAYRTAMSSPVTAFDACSRLSPHLAMGTLSIRQAHHATERMRTALRDDRERAPGHLASLKSFAGRLRWHCHFIQKLEDEPGLEWHNMDRTADGLRTEDAGDWSADEQERFERWCQGLTGYPMVDACMRALRAHGWINFRMRAMLMSFAGYHLWLHWREPALHLARLFTDFEPGIHYSQCQMQTGTTGINTPRIYSPPKQVVDQDPEGVFIRRWVPELAGVPKSWLARPQAMTARLQQRYACRIGSDYPEPVVDHRRAYHGARERIASLRRAPGQRGEAQRVYRKHGSRKRPAQRR
jgi:deoxyribodipyrimidine photo-lyase